MTIQFKEKYNTYICKCDCGIVVKRMGSRLSLIKNPSCGCRGKGYVEPNKKYGMLTVIQKSPKYINSRIQWECLCECGQQTTASSNQLISGGKESCGCKRNNTLSKRRGKKHNQWTGHGDISGYWFASFRNNAKHRNMKFSITIEDVWNKYIEQNRKCAISGIEINFVNDRYLCNQGTASIDRIDSKIKEYRPDNIQIVHKKVNLMKRDMSDEEFVTWCKLITENNI